MGSRICPLLWQNCSMMAADSRAARVTIWYGFFTAVGSFSGSCLATGFYRNRRHRRLPTFNYVRGTIVGAPPREITHSVGMGTLETRMKSGCAGDRVSPSESFLQIANRTGYLGKDKQ